MKTIGIIGGMGPEATLDLFHKIVSSTSAGSDQEHLPLLIDNNPQIPDRSEYILHGGENPFPFLLRSAKNLEMQGAEALCMPCNTAHFFLDQIREEISIPFLSIIESTYQAIRQKMPDIKKVGLLATLGTIKTGIYEDIFTAGGIEIINLSEEGQKRMMHIIYNGVKAGDIESHLDSFEALIQELADQGAEAVIAGCTEIPLLAQYITPPIPLCDPTLFLAQNVVKHSCYQPERGAAQ